MEYELIYFSGFPDGFWSIQKTNDDGSKLAIPFDENNSDYQQYLIDTDGGLPIPEGA